MGWFGKGTARSKNVANDRGNDAARSNPLLTTFERHAALNYPDMPPDRAMRRMMDAYAYLVADGDDLDMRVAIESRMLAKADPYDLADRLEHTSLPRIDPYPEDHDARLEWIAEVLRSERRDVAEGRMPLHHALAVAAAPRGETPMHLRGGQTVVGAGPSRTSDAEIQAAAHQIVRMPSRLLYHRFKHVPGVLEETIPSEGRIQDRLFWLEGALRAAETRELCGLATTRREDAVPMVAGLDIGLTDIEMESTHDDLLVFAARLLVSGEPACIVSSPGDGTLQGSGWAEGFVDEDLDVLDAYVRLACPLREDANGVRETGLMDVVLDQVMAWVATMAYRNATVDAVLFCPDASDEHLELLSVPIPEGGSRPEAIDYVRSRYPLAIVLDEMHETDAVSLWTTLS